MTLADRLGRGSPLHDALRAQTLAGPSAGGGAASGTLTTASFLTLALEAGLSAERVFTPGAGLSAVDGGANGAYTLGVDGTVARSTWPVNPGAGMTGGGNLAAAGITLGVDATVARSTWAINAGAGLTGGGNLAAGGITIDVGAGTGITVAANSIAVDQSTAFAWTGAQTWANTATFNAGARIAAGQQLQFGTDVALSRKNTDLLQLATGDDFEAATYTSGFQGWHIDSDGSAEFNNITARGEFHTAVLVYGEVHATAGTFGVFKSAGKLRADLTTVTTPATSSLDIEDPDVGHVQLFAVNDLVRLKDGSGADNWLKVTAVSDQTTFWRYTVDKKSGSNTTFRAGAAVADYGTSGAGMITLSADGGVGSAANLSIATHAGAPWTTQTLRVRLGNLNGSYGQASDTYGIGLGDYAGGNYLVYEPTGGFVLKAGAGAVTIDGNGVNIRAASAPAAFRSYKLDNSSAAVISQLSAFEDASTSYTGLTAYGYDTRDGKLVLTSVAGVTGAHNALLRLATSNNSGEARFDIRTNSSGQSFAQLYSDDAGIPVLNFSGLLIGQDLTENTVPGAMIDVRGNAFLGGGVGIGTATSTVLGEVKTSGYFWSAINGISQGGLFGGTGADVQLYRSAADTWRTPDSLTVDGVLNAGIAGTANGIVIQSNMQDGSIALRNDHTNTLVFASIRPNAGNKGYLSFTEDSVADRWNIGIKNGDALLYFRSGSVDTATDRMSLSAASVLNLPSGSITVTGTQVVGARVTGYTNAWVTTAAEKAAARDAATITLVQLAQRVRALQESLTTHGLIGV